MERGRFSIFICTASQFYGSKLSPSESHWAELREAQLKSLSVPNTGMAVAIDFGEWNDIHPAEKKMLANVLHWPQKKLLMVKTILFIQGQFINHQILKAIRSLSVLQILAVA